MTKLANPWKSVAAVDQLAWNGEEGGEGGDCDWLEGGEEVNEKGKEREMVGRSVGERGELGTEEGAEEVIISLPCISVLFMQQLLLY